MWRPNSDSNENKVLIFSTSVRLLRIIAEFLKIAGRECVPLQTQALRSRGPLLTALACLSLVLAGSCSSTAACLRATACRWSTSSRQTRTSTSSVRRTACPPLRPTRLSPALTPTPVAHRCSHLDPRRRSVSPVVRFDLVAFQADPRSAPPADSTSRRLTRLSSSTRAGTRPTTCRCADRRRPSVAR